MPRQLELAITAIATGSFTSSFRAVRGLAGGEPLEVGLVSGGRNVHVAGDDFDAGEDGGVAADHGVLDPVAPSTSRIRCESNLGLSSGMEGRAGWRRFERAAQRCTRGRWSEASAIRTRSTSNARHFKVLAEPDRHSVGDGGRNHVRQLAGVDNELGSVRLEHEFRRRIDR
jgi:hypothetical protein